MTRLCIVEKGRSRYRIVIAGDAIPSERYAAEELQRYIAYASGATLPIVTDAVPLGDEEIILGDNAHLRAARPDVGAGMLGSEEFVLLTSGTYLIIAGGKPRGTLYGVYEFLEEKLGVRWFAPHVEHVPKAETVILGALNERYAPRLQYRETSWTEMSRDADFAARHRLNGHHDALTDRHGGRAVVYYPYYPFVHTLDLLVPQELYDEHPEYFPFIDGVRVKGNVQRCLSNADVVRLAAGRVRHWIEEHRDAHIVEVSQNDAKSWCRCKACSARDGAQGGPAGSLIQFVNTVAESIEKDYPEVYVGTLAYQYSRTPPRTLRPRKNVIVRICSWECCFSHPLVHCSHGENARFREDILAWQRSASMLYAWDYTTNFAHYIQPFPNLDALQANVQFYVDCGVKGLFEQGNSSPGGGGEMAALKGYLLAKLMWNPAADVKRHMDEFLKGYFGRASDLVAAYLELLHRQVRDGSSHALIYDGPSSAYLSDGFLKEAERLFDEAERSTGPDEVRARIHNARLGVWYVMLASGRVLNAGHRDAVLERFLSAARSAGITHVSEYETLSGWAQRMGEETAGHNGENGRKSD